MSIAARPLLGLVSRNVAFRIGSIRISANPDRKHFDYLGWYAKVLHNFLSYQKCVILHHYIYEPSDFRMRPANVFRVRVSHHSLGYGSL